MAWKIHRRRRTCFYDLKIIRILVIAGILMGMLFLGFEAGSRVRAAEKDQMSAWRLIGFWEGDWQKIISQVLPMASYMPEYVEDESTGIIIAAMKDITATDLNNPVSFLKNQIAYFDSRPVNADPEFIPEEESEEKPPALEPESENEHEKSIIPDETQQPLVGIYCTHSAESYLPSQGADKLEGKNGGVFLVASHLQETLEKEYGIKAVLSDTIHDYPDWSKSYANSLKTVENMKRNYPSIQLFIDLHRDTTSKDSTTAKINGKKASKIMFVVGSDTRLPHPAWKKNRDFAQSIAAEMEELYPGLLKGVRVQDGRYNQHVSSRAVLLEMGGTENTLEETKRSAEMFADVINNMAKRR